MTLHKSANGRRLQPWLLCLMLLVVAGFAIIAVSKPGASLAFDNEQVQDFNDGWELLDAPGQPEGNPLPITLPTKIETDRAVRVAKTVPNDIMYPAVLGMRTAHQMVRLYCDNELIYSFGYDDPPVFGKSPGSSWNIIRLPRDVAGKRLTLELYSPYDAYKGRMERIQLGSKASLMLSLLRLHTFSFLLTLIILGAGITTLIAYFMIIRKDPTIGKETLYLGLFAVFVSFWLFGEGRLTQFFGIPPAVNTYFTFIAMLATPIPLINYIACDQHAFRCKLLGALTKFFSMLFIASILLQAFGVLDFIEQLPFLHACLIISCVVMLYVVVCDAIEHRNVEQYRLMISLGILALFFLLETVLLYIRDHNIGGMMRIGVLAVIGIQAQAAFKKASNIIHMSHLAGVDALTGCLNRTVYNQLIVELDGQEGVGVVIADVNDLKMINDVYGHDVGDDAITRCAKHFSETFASVGSCFRIGGDEFAMLGKNLSLEQLSNMGETFGAMNGAADAQLSYPFTVSHGYAIYDPQHDRTLSDTVRRADKAMYLNKRQFKCSDAAAQNVVNAVRP